MKIAWPLAILFLMPFHLFAQNTIIRGHLKGLKAGQVKLVYPSGNGQKTDSVKVVDGKFTWKGNLAEPQHMSLVLPNKFYVFYAQSGKISITGISDSTETYVVTGSRIEDERVALEKSIKDLTDQERPLYHKYIIEPHGRASKEEQTKLGDTLEEKLAPIQEEINKRVDQYIMSHPSSFYSIELVAQRAAYETDYARLEKAYDMLDESAKQTAAGKTLTNRMNVMKRSTVGIQMMDFTQNDTSGLPVRFADFKGKYVLVDFWASWCGPCRAENPNVLKAYNEYKDKNFTVIGISLDDKANNWKKAIRDDHMPWAELSDLKGWKNEVSTYYGVQGIPSNLLVDPSGKIIVKDLRGEALHKKLSELFN
jgi:peroxiredoxin